MFVWEGRGFGKTSDAVGYDQGENSPKSGCEVFGRTCKAVYAVHPEGYVLYTSLYAVFIFSLGSNSYHHTYNEHLFL